MPDYNEIGSFEASDGTIPSAAPSLKSVKTVAPAVIDLLSTTVAMAFDGAVLGRFSSIALASGGLGLNILFFLFTIFLTFVMGSAIPIAWHLGAGERYKADKIFANALVAVAFLGLFFAIIAFFFSPIFFDKLIGATGELRQNAVAYLRTLAPFIPFIALNFVGTGILRASGETIGAMVANLVANISFAVLAIVLVFGFPALGISAHGAVGSALAIGIGQTIGFLIMVGYSMREKSLVRLKFSHITKFEFVKAKRIVKTGFPSTVELFFWMFGQIVILAYITRIGYSELAGHQILIRLTQTLGVIYQAFAFGNMAFCGHKIGAGDNLGASRTSNKMRYFSLLVGTFIALIVFVFRKNIALIFTKDPAVFLCATSVMPILAVQQLAKSQTMITTSELRARGDLPFIAWMCGIFVLLNEILLSALAVFVFRWGLPAIWALLVIDELERLIVHRARLSKRIVKKI